jgi:ribosomal protein L32
MAKIHGIVYMIVGAIVALVSWKIDYNDLLIFFYIGILFLVIGLFKIFMSLARKDEVNQSVAQEEKPHHLRHIREGSKQHHTVNQHNRAQYHPQRQHQQNTHTARQQVQYKRCKNCGNPARLHDNFCSNCGYNI